MPVGGAPEGRDLGPLLETLRDRMAQRESESLRGRQRGRQKERQGWMVHHGGRARERERESLRV